MHIVYMNCWYTLTFFLMFGIWLDHVQFFNNKKYEYFTFCSFFNSDISYFPLIICIKSRSFLIVLSLGTYQINSVDAADHRAKSSSINLHDLAILFRNLCFQTPVADYWFVNDQSTTVELHFGRRFFIWKTK